VNADRNRALLKRKYYTKGFKCNHCKKRFDKQGTLHLHIINAHHNVVGRVNGEDVVYEKNLEVTI